MVRNRAGGTVPNGARCETADWEPSPTVQDRAGGTVPNGAIPRTGDGSVWCETAQ